MIRIRLDNRGKEMEIIIFTQNPMKIVLHFMYAPYTL